jgi:Do/DeqQ family serine protease
LFGSDVFPELFIFAIETGRKRSLFMHMKLRLVHLIVICFAIVASSVVQAQQRVVPEYRSQVMLSFGPLVERTAPAVVNIYTQHLVQNRQIGALFDDPFFRRFFGDLGQRFDRQPQQQANSLGSGVIVRSDGLIVTNKHVIQGANKIVVVLADKREFEARLMISDDRTDLAILRIDPEGEQLPALEISDSDRVVVGDIVLAIGNPFGVGQTVTSGIVSALARSIGSGKELKSFIQTDAAINPGNSGGALVSMDGKLVGVNTAIFSKSGGSHGIGFAIPSNMVRAVITGMQENGRLIRPWLGAAGQTVTADIAASLSMRVPQGVIVSQVHEDGSAGRAGLLAGDVILAVNGYEISGPDDLGYRIATLPVGDRAVLRVRRGDNIIPLTVDLLPAPSTIEPDLTELGGNHPLVGAVVANLSPAVAEEHQLDPFNSGVVILQIRRGSVADRLDFRPGDIVQQVNGGEASSVAVLRELVSNPQSSEWLVRVGRGGRSFDLKFRG